MIKDHFAKFGLFPCPQEPVLYSYRKDGVILLVNTLMDNFLCAFSEVVIFQIGGPSEGDIWTDKERGSAIRKPESLYHFVQIWDVERSD